MSVDDIDGELENLALEKKFKQVKAPRVIQKYALQKAEYRRLRPPEHLSDSEKQLFLEKLTDKEKQLIQAFEERSDAMAQSVRANKPNPNYNVGAHEKLKPGFLNGSGHNFYKENELTSYNPDPAIDPVLHKNIEAFKAKLAADKLLSHPSLKGNPLRDKGVCHLLMKHVNESFPVDNEDALEILKEVGAYQTRNRLGDYIDTGVGVCRHKFMLTKAIADHVGLDISMNSGMFSDMGPHAWNQGEFGNVTHVLDAHNDFFAPWNDFVASLYRQGKTRYDT